VANLLQALAGQRLKKIRGGGEQEAAGKGRQFFSGRPALLGEKVPMPAFIGGQSQRAPLKMVSLARRLRQETTVIWNRMAKPMKLGAAGCLANLLRSAGKNRKWLCDLFDAWRQSNEQRKMDKAMVRRI